MMNIPRIIPVLLLSQSRLVKSIHFKRHRYIGDPINTIRIFNEKEVDELVILDIDASNGRGLPDFHALRDIVSECFAPLAYGGGITSVEHAAEVFRIGVEKVVINSAFFRDPKLVSDIAERFGSQSVIVAIDVSRSVLGSYRAYSNSGKVKHKGDLIDWIRLAEQSGAGEIMITSIDRDGTFKNYDVDLIRLASEAVKIPVIANGGASCLMDIKQVIQFGGASAAAAGSLFVFQGRNQGVLINYPARQKIETLFSE